MDKKLFNLVQEWLALNEQKKAIEARMKALGANITEIVGVGNKVAIGDITVNVVPVQRLSIHDHALQESFPALYERSLKPNTTALKKAAEVLGVQIRELEQANAVTVKHTHRLDIRGKAL